MKLITTDTNWTDEMDIWGFEVIPDDNIYQICLDAINECFKYVSTIEVSIGTNESISFKKDFLRNFIIKNVQQKEVDVLIELFGNHTKGHNLFEQLLNESLYILSINDVERSKEFDKQIYGEIQ